MIQRLWLLAGGILVVIALGVLVAWRLDLSGETPTSPSPPTVRLQAATLGTLAAKNEVGKSDPKIKQQGYYYTTDPLVLRLVSDTTVPGPFTVNVRLLRDDGETVALSPDQATFAAGTSSFCCWYVPHAGEYTFQIFYDRRVLTSIPLSIQPGEAAPTSAL